MIVSIVNGWVRRFRVRPGTGSVALQRKVDKSRLKNDKGLKGRVGTVLISDANIDKNRPEQKFMLGIRTEDSLKNRLTNQIP